ncbi:NAD(P)/FAD-dependent oxidoreductase [Paracoccus contaminans]|uniref:Aminoacetone oxidase family FAD-binding enzyme n=1 Tax=Paracoccus contaminans TaxID=1945662 RepID=A0A1W6CUB1_9RHOB|nr:aminoacetone oxidase family FAD-binding enzyme [Paracoccus contaminans]ARJ68425.1 hypothetical protein B0A89_00940 [Paracoccus contaminans]
MEQADVVILGAGAAGLFCAGRLGALIGAGGARRIVVLDHGREPGEKIRISGGGRCNFTNIATAPDRFVSQTPRFCASALAGFAPQDFVALVDRAGIAWHEKTQGQLFCDGSARQIVTMLTEALGGCQLRLGVGVEAVAPGAAGEPFIVHTTAGPIGARRVVVATGGKSIPKMGASGIGYRIAEATGHRIVPTRPGLVPLTFAEQELRHSAALAGVSVEAAARVAAAPRKGQRAPLFRDALLFTHRGLSGPAILQISNFWQPGEALSLDLAPGRDLDGLLRQARGEGGRARLATVLGRWLPARLAGAVLDQMGLAEARIADQSDAALARLAERLSRWQVVPVGSEGYRTAEVTVGGVDCRDLDARTLQSRHMRGLFFIGEVVDVTGWLGGYNFQWAWASADAAARAIGSDG